jgi:hypothetical protein
MGTQRLEEEPSALFLFLCLRSPSHVSRLMSHVSRLTSHVNPLTVTIHH